MYEWGGAGKLSTWYKVVTWNFFNRLTYFFLVVGHPSPHSWPLKTCFSIIIRFRVYWDEKVRIFFRNVISSLSFTFKIVKIVLVKYSWIIRLKRSYGRSQSVIPEQLEGPRVDPRVDPRYSDTLQERLHCQNLDVGFFFFVNICIRLIFTKEQIEQYL